MFLDIERDTQRVQAMVDLKKLTNLDHGLEDGFKSFKKVARVGDWICEHWHSLIFYLSLTNSSRERKPD
jgi:hypothetical protein